jgi:Fe2+ transport system protein FeoA
MTDVTYDDLKPIERYSILKITDGESLHISEAKARLLELGLIMGSGIQFMLTKQGAKVVRHLRRGVQMNVIEEE